MYIGDLLNWAVTYQYHTHNETYCVASFCIGATDIGTAIANADEYISQMMENCKWSDYIITSVCIIPELH